jgi:hypothetical protein
MERGLTLKPLAFSAGMEDTGRWRIGVGKLRPERQETATPATNQGVPI